MGVYLSNEGYPNPSVGSNQLHQNLRADVPQQVLDVFSDEGIFHDGLPGEEGKGGRGQNEWARGIITRSLQSLWAVDGGRAGFESSQRHGELTASPGLP